MKERWVMLGPLVVRTGQHTGRLPQDKLLVREPSSESKIWWGEVNRPMEPAKFDALKHRLCAYLQGKDVFIQNCYAGADERYRVPIRVVGERAWHALFARNMFIRELDLGTAGSDTCRNLPSSTRRISTPTRESTARNSGHSCCCTSARSSFSSAAPPTPAKSRNPSSR